MDENRKIFIPHLCLAPTQGVTRRNFVKMFDDGKTRLIRLPYGEKNYDDMLSRFHLIPERYGRTDRQTDGRTDGQTDRFAISISRVSMLTRDKNWSLLRENRIIFLGQTPRLTHDAPQNSPPR